MNKKKSKVMFNVEKAIQGEVLDMLNDYEYLSRLEWAISSLDPERRRIG